MRSTRGRHTKRLNRTLRPVAQSYCERPGDARKRDQRKPWLPVDQPLRWLDRYSYEVYLTHEIVVICVLGLFLDLRKGSAYLWVISVVALSGLVGRLISTYVSEPLNRMLRGAPLPAQLSS